MPPPVRRAFTFPEILVILLIICILAALVVPRFTSAAGSRDTSAQTTLRYLRDQINLFKSQHAGIPPQTGTLWLLLQRTSDTAETNALSPAGAALGPYFHANPTNPWNGSSTVNSTSIDPNAGWFYSAGPSTYELRIRNADGSINYQY